MNHSTKLLGPDDFFATHKFAEVLSPLVEPADDDTDRLLRDQLHQLGFASERPSTVGKLQVLLASFLMQATRLEGRKERKGEPMVIGIAHDEAYLRVSVIPGQAFQ